MVILIEKEVEVSVNNYVMFIFLKNYLVVFVCNNNVIEFLMLNYVLIIYINCNIINDYLLFLNKNLICVKFWLWLVILVIVCYSCILEVFWLVVNYSK